MFAAAFIQRAPTMFIYTLDDTEARHATRGAISLQMLRHSPHRNITAATATTFDATTPP